MKQSDPGSTGIPPKQIQEMMAEIFARKDDPYSFVMFCFPWGKKGTRLERFKGPAAWQTRILLQIRDHIAENKARVTRGEEPQVLKIAIASGRGIGKSALVSWLSYWMLSCLPGSTVQISANTDDQLSHKTFAELGKWHTLAVNSYWFDRNVKKVMPMPWYVTSLKKDLGIDDTYYYINGALWDEDNPAAFAGVHSDVGVMLIFDEASGIPSSIWKESDGVFTENTIYRFWLAFSNPRRNSGAFYDCFHEHSEFWNTEQINALAVETEYSDKSLYREIISKYGQDSDEAKIHVYGQFPDQSERQFIPRGLVTEARYRSFDRTDDQAAFVMGVDPARFGGDATVIRFRRGRDARSIPPIELNGKDNMYVANLVADLIEERSPDAVFIDSGGGTGIIDRLNEMGYKRLIHEVSFSGKVQDDQYSDHRTELWGMMREWLVGGMIDSHPKLLTDLCAPEWLMTKKEQKKLESKDDMKKRGIRSTDHADALALTFHAKIARRDLVAQNQRTLRRSRIAKDVDYNIFGGGK